MRKVWPYADSQYAMLASSVQMHASGSKPSVLTKHPCKLVWLRSAVPNRKFRKRGAANTFSFPVLVEVVRLMVSAWFGWSPLHVVEVVTVTVVVLVQIAKKASGLRVHCLLLGRGLVIGERRRFSV